MDKDQELERLIHFAEAAFAEHLTVVANKFADEAYAESETREAEDKAALARIEARFKMNMERVRIEPVQPPDEAFILRNTVERLAISYRLQGFSEDQVLRSLVGVCSEIHAKDAVRAARVIVELVQVIQADPEGIASPHLAEKFLPALKRGEEEYFSI